MGFQGKEYIEYAVHLNDEIKSFGIEKKALTQAALRAVASRAYYGAFLEARDYLGLQNDRQRSVHGVVRDAMQEKDRKIGSNMSALIKNRTKADYRSHESMSGKEAAESLRLASNVLEYIEKQLAM